MIHFFTISVNFYLNPEYDKSVTLVVKQFEIICLYPKRFETINVFKYLAKDLEV